MEADSLALGADAYLLENEELLGHDLAVLAHARDLGDADDAADTAAETRLLNDEVNRGADRLADGSRRQVLPCLQDQGLETDQTLARVVGVKRRHRAIVAGVHGLEHVQRLAATTLTDDDAVGAHTEAALDQLTDGHRALALDVGRTRLELDPVRLLQLQLGGVFAGDEALVLGDERREDVQQRRLAGAGATRDQDVQARADAGAQEGHDLRARRAEAVDDVGRPPLLLGELADGQSGSLQGDGWNDHVHTRAVFEARVTDGGRLVDATADEADDAVDDLAHLALGLERHRRQDRLTALFDVDLLRMVGHDLGDVRVGEQRLERTETENVVQDRVDKALLVVLGHGHRRGAEVLLGELDDLLPDARLVRRVDLVGELFDQLGVDLHPGGREGRGDQIGRAHV